MPTKNKDLQVFKFNVECSKEKGGGIAEILNIPGLKLKAKTREELKNKIHNTVSKGLEVYKDFSNNHDKDKIHFSNESILGAIESKNSLIN